MLLTLDSSVIIAALRKQEEKQNIMRLLIKIFLVIIICYCDKAVSQENMIAQDGNTNYRIMVGANASETEIFAAQELQGYLLQVSGAFMPMANADERSYKYLILVGEGALYLAGLRFDGQMTDPDGFSIKTYGSRIALYGGSSRGTLYSVYAFLEMLGCRWYAPGIIGEVIPRLSNIALADAEYTEKPSIKYRCFSSYADTFQSIQWIDWMVKNRMNCILIPITGYDEFKKMMYGEIERRGLYIAVKYDYSEEKQLQDFIKSNPEIDILEMPLITGFEIIESTIQLLRDTNIRISILIQGELSRDVNLKDRSVTLDPESRCYRHSIGDEGCEINAKYRAYIDDMLKLCTNIHIYEHCMSSYSQNSLPFPVLNTMASDIKYINSSFFSKSLSKKPEVINNLSKKIDGLVSQADTRNWGTYGLNYYVFTKLTWNSNYNLGSIIDDYCDKFYGAASASMKEYFAMLEDSMLLMKHFFYVESPEIINKLLSEETIANLETQINKAKSLSNDVMIFDRIRKTQLSLEYAADLWRLQDNYSRAVSLQKSGDHSAAEKLASAIEIGDRLVKFLFEHIDEEVFIITEDYIFNYLEPMISDARMRLDSE